MKRIVIVANGSLGKTFLSEIRRIDYIVGVDHIAYWLIKHGIIPHIAIGDFDSCTQEEIKEIKKKVADVTEYPSEKDKTDLELAVDHVIALHPKKVIIYGAMGKRLDHELASVFLLKRLLDEGIEGILKDSQNEVCLVKTQIEMQKSKRFTYLSLLPYTKRITVTLQGFKYNVQRKTITKGETTGVSNEIIDKTCVI